MNMTSRIRIYVLFLGVLLPLQSIVKAVDETEDAPPYTPSDYLISPPESHLLMRDLTDEAVQEANDDVARWEQLYTRLYGDGGEALANSEVRSMLAEMLELEKKGAIKDERNESDKDFKAAFESFNRLEIHLKNEKMLQDIDVGLTENLLLSFEVDSINCLEHRLIKITGLMIFIKDTPIHHTLQENLKAQKQHCWLRFIKTFEETTNWLGSHALKPLDELMRNLRLPTDRFLELDQSVTRRNSKVDEVYARAIATYLSNRPSSHTSLSLRKVEYSGRFMGIFKDSCSDLVMQTGISFRRIMRWLKSFGKIDKEHHFIKPEHYKMFNRFQMCTKIYNASNLRTRVLDMLSNSELESGDENSGNDPKRALEEPFQKRPKKKKNVEKKAGTENKKKSGVKLVTWFYQPETGGQIDIAPLSTQQQQQQLQQQLTREGGASSETFENSSESAMENN